MIISRINRPALTKAISFNKIQWNNGSTYNTRWAFKWKHAYYSYLRDGAQHANVKRPQDSKNIVPLFYTWFQDMAFRSFPWSQMVWNRRHRVSDNFQAYVLPSLSLFFYQFSDYSTGFKMLTALPFLMAYIRIRDKCEDPDFKQTYLRQIVFTHPQIMKYFNHRHTIVLDYDCQYDKGFLDNKVWPQFNNKLFRFFNTDGHTTHGHFNFQCLDSGSNMIVKFKTMPIRGKFRYQVGQPFYFYDLRAVITSGGQTKEVVIVDEQESRKQIKPFLILI